MAATTGNKQQDTFTRRMGESHSPPLNRTVDGGAQHSADAAAGAAENSKLNATAKSGKSPAAAVIAPGNPDVNEYIVKIEMKKF